MQTVNFNCSHCKKLMAVGLTLLGRNVRCPHCKQVVQAPATAGANPPPVATQTRSPTSPSFQPAPPPVESQESIFGETHDDDLFGTKQPKVRMPGEAPPPAMRCAPRSCFPKRFRHCRRLALIPYTRRQRRNSIRNLHRLRWSLGCRVLRTSLLSTMSRPQHMTHLAEARRLRRPEAAAACSSG